jgi:sulfur carrier protein ThiS
MKIRFSNLGTIRETELDLRPLTVIIGPNNSSKTYLAYSVYGLLREMKNVGDEVFERLRSVRVDREHGYVEWSLRRLENAFQAHVESTCRSFEGQLGGFFQDSSGKLFRQTKFQVDVDPPNLDEIGPPFEVVGKQARLGLGAPVLRIEAPYLYDRNVNSKLDKLALLEAADFLGKFMRGDAGGFIPAPFILPAERNALIITYKILSNRRFKLLRDAARSRKIGARGGAALQEALQEQGEIRYPLPVEDFLDFLADVELPATHAARAPNAAFVKLAAMVEASIQSGNRLELVPTVLGGNELRVGVGEGLSIDLYNASSSIKQLSALILYLRYKAAPGQLLIIDEPEMNLHPASQVRLLEVLAILVRLGVRVLVTTHSPYFMAHLANLAQRADDPKTQKKQASQLYLKDARALLSLDEVSAYEMRDNRLVSLKDPDFGLRWDTLSDVFSDLQQRFFTLDGLAHGKRGK